MQEVLFQTPRFNSDSVITHINCIAAAIRQNAGKVIFIQHNGTDEEGLAKHSEGWAILSALEVLPTDTILEKSICDAFFQTELFALLKALHHERVIVTGCATDFCVDTTIRSAVSHDLNVVVVSDGHTTADRPHLDAHSIIAHHNWMWANLITPKTPVKLVNAADLLVELTGTIIKYHG